ncbi:MAG TPA: hypothetical protein VM582_05540, partial [Candidatus Thermoplasmatota archaeon]|nr:hypothetical protein [Candidatus Thermoplasmatota archaeon]
MTPTPTARTLAAMLLAATLLAGCTAPDSGLSGAAVTETSGDERIDAGPAIQLWRGAYAQGTTYQPGHVVLLGGVVYI